MRPFAVILLAAICSLVLQTTVAHMLPLGPAAPDLLLMLCVYLGLHQHNIAGALGAFGLGYVEDLASGSATGFGAFAMSGVFLLVYLTSRRLWVDNLLSKVVVVFLASLVKTLAVMVLFGLFLSLDGLWITLVRPLLLQASLAGAAAPLLFAFLTFTCAGRSAEPWQQ